MKGKTMKNETAKRNVVIKTRRGSYFSSNNALEYCVVDTDTNKILAWAYLPRGRENDNIHKIFVGGKEMNAFEVIQERFGKFSEAVQKEYYGKNHPKYKGILNPAYRTRHSDYTNYMELILKTAYLKTLLLELVEESDVDFSVDAYYLHGTFTETN